MQERRTVLLLLIASLALCAAAAEAQPLIFRDMESRSLAEALNTRLPIQFTLAPPGARSLGMGGAFIALADDATASESNPAGLTVLQRDEFSLHMRDYSFDGTIDDPKTAISLRVANEVRTSEGLGGQVPASASQRDARDSSTDLSFASYVKNFPKWVFSVYYNRFANFAASSIVGLGPGASAQFPTLAPQNGAPAGFTDQVLLDDYRGSARTEILAESFGLSGAFNVTQKLSFGISVRATQLDVDNRDLFQIEDFSDLEREAFQFGSQSGPFFLNRSEFTDIIRTERVVRGSDTDLTYNLGFLWKNDPLSPTFSLGVVLKKGGEFDIPRTTTAFDCVDFVGLNPTTRQNLIGFIDNFPAVSEPCNAAANTGDFVLENRTISDRESIIIPDLLGAGIAWRPNEKVTVAVDLNRITYSDLSPAPIRGPDGRPLTESIDDELELHVGVERVFLPRGSDYPLTLRAGFFNEPDHDGFANVDSSDQHITLGAGLAVKRDYQFDLAGSFSDRQDVIIFSFVYRR